MLDYVQNYLQINLHENVHATRVLILTEKVLGTRKVSFVLMLFLCVFSNPRSEKHGLHPKNSR